MTFYDLLSLWRALSHVVTCLKLFRAALPSLRTLSWTAPCTRGLVLLDNINWAQLIDLHLRCNLSIENCLSVIYHSALLRHCHLETICVDEVVPSDLSIKPLIRLQSLQMDTNISFVPLLQALTLPALDSLTLSATAPQARFTRSTSFSLLNLLRRSHSPLRSLTLNNTRNPRRNSRTRA